MSSAHTERRDLELAGITAAEVASFNGSITIEIGSAPPHLEAVITGRATYKVERIGQLLYVSARKRGFTYLGSGVSFALWLPAGLALKLANVNGAIDVTGAVSRLDAAASGGTITTRSTGSGALRLMTSNGEIAAQAAQGSVKAITSSGTMRLDQIGGRIEVTTSTGEIQLQRASGQVYVTSANGAITIADADAQVFINTSNGNVRIANAQGQFQIASHNGAVRLERTTFAAASTNWISSHSGPIEALGIHAPAGLRLRAKTHQHVIQAHLPGYSVRRVRGGRGLKAQLPGDQPATLDLINHGEMRISG